MKETINLSLWFYEFITGWIVMGRITNKALKFFIALGLFPLLIFFAFLALFIEEPLKCILSLVFMKTTPKKAWEYYRRCWGSLIGGYKHGN